MSMVYYTYTNLPVGPVMLVGDGQLLSALYWREYKHIPAPGPDWIEDASKFADVLSQLNEYFAGERTSFTIAHEAEGTPFQKAVWKELSAIAYGETRSYQEIANAVGAPDAPRAIGAAIGKNPLSIIVPCHRVVASNGKLTGFAGGLESKQALLELEGALPGRQLSFLNP